MNWTYLVALAAGLLQAAADGTAEAARKDQELFQGTWETILLRQNGGDVPDDQLKEILLEIRGDERVLKVGGEVRSRSRFKLDPSKTPKAIDVVTGDGGAAKTRPGIYRIDRDVQVVCLGDPGGERPREFAAAAGSGVGNGPTLSVFRRPGSNAKVPVFKGEEKAAAKVAAPELRRELLDRMKADQDFRRRLDKFFRKGPANQTAEEKEELKELTAKGRKVDAENTAWLKGVVDKHGWPGFRLVGSDGELAAFLLVQHADEDPAFQKKCLPLLAAAVKAKDARAQHLAYLTDRVSMKEKNKQVYGTQVRVADGRAEPLPIEDEARVDERRKEVGLPPLADYLKLFKVPAAAKSGDKAKDSR